MFVKANYCGQVEDQDADKKRKDLDIVDSSHYREEILPQNEY